jgi:hypothetical protein
MSSFNVVAQSYVPGVTINAIGPAKDGSWSIQVARTNFAEEAELGQIATVFLVPAEIVDPTKPTVRNIAVIPGSCSDVQVFVGPCTLTTTDSHDFLGLEVRSTETSGDNSAFQEPFIIGRR